MSFEFLNDWHKKFSHLPTALYPTNAWLTQSLRYLGATMEVEHWFYGKLKLYRYKFKTSVLPLRLAINCTTHFHDSNYDLDVFQGDIKNCTYMPLRKVVKRGILIMIQSDKKILWPLKESFKTKTIKGPKDFCKEVSQS